MKIYLDSKIRINKSELDQQIVKELKEALSFTVQQYQSDDKIFSFFEEDKSNIILPRGFLPKLLQGLELSNINYELIDNTVWPVYINDSFKEIKLRDHQIDPVKTIVNRKTGIYQAPPGSGKTVALLESIRRSNTNALVLVDKVSIANQWRERAGTFLDIKTGFIGDGTHSEEQVTVALKQTLWSKKRELSEQGFFNRWGFVIFDECHHITADSYQYIVEEFNSKFLIGISATPHMNEGLEKVLHFLLGDIIYKTEEEELRGRGILVRPIVKVINTNFKKKYIKNGKWNNYQQILKAICNDYERNSLIAREINNNINNTNLVISRRLDQLENIKNELLKTSYPHKILFLTGKESREEKIEIIKYIENNLCTVFSTIADEALDIPKLDRLFIVFPTSKKDLLRQQIGRIERSHNNKSIPIVIDFCDSKTDILFNQFCNRKLVYLEKKIEIFPPPPLKIFHCAGYLG